MAIMRRSQTMQKVLIAAILYGLGSRILISRRATNRYSSVGVKVEHLDGSLRVQEGFEPPIMKHQPIREKKGIVQLARQHETWSSSAVSPNSTVIGKDISSNLSDKRREKDEMSNGFSACILTMDDNVLWPEWLAYHYQTLPLRRLIVALDPKSKTKPSELFTRYRKHGLSLDVTVWENDEFLPNEEYKNLIALDARSQNVYMDHWRRQKWFLHKCLEQLYTENRSWVLLVDTDEFVVPQWRSLIVDGSGTNNKVSTKPRNILDILTKYRDQAFPVDVNANYSQWLDDISRGCVYMYRRRFIPFPSNTTTPTGEVVPYPILTMEQARWFPQYNGKVMLDLSKLSPASAKSIFEDELLGSHTSPHLGLDTLCEPMKNATALSPRPFAAHHYGMPITWVERRSHDPRHEYKLKQRRREQKQAKAVFNHTELPFAAAWVDGFVKSVTKEIALELLRPIE